MKALNSKGMSLVYVMICLIIIGMTTTALIKMSHKSSLTQIQYSNSESARLAVIAGFDNALSFLETDNKADQEKVLAALQNWIDAKKPEDIKNPWIVGGKNLYTSINSSNEASKDCKFKVKILGFDPDKYALCLQTQGEGRGGSRASAIGTYIIDGLGYDKKKGITPTHALYLGSGADEINTELIVNGSTYMNETGKFYKGGHTFNGEFRRDANGSTDTLNMRGSTFNGPAYFIDGELKFFGTQSTFNKGLGSSSSIYVQGGNCPKVTAIGAFFNAPFKCQNHNGNMNLNNVPLIAYGKDSDFSAAAGSGLAYLHSDGKAPDNDPGELVTGKLKIYDLLSIEENNPPQIDVDLEKIKAHTGIINYAPGSALPNMTKNKGLSGSDLDSLYQKNKSRYFKNDWLIVNLQAGDSSKHFDTTSANGFSGKIILLVEDENLSISTSMYNSSSSMVTFLLLGSDKQNT